MAPRCVWSDTLHQEEEEGAGEEETMPRPPNAVRRSVLYVPSEENLPTPASSLVTVLTLAHTHKHAQTRTQTHASTRTQTHTHTHTHMHTCSHARTNKHICTYTHKRTHTHIEVYMNIHMCTYTHTHEAKQISKNGTQTKKDINEERRP